MQGNRATAHVVTRTNLANATTDTTINFMLAEDPAAPYLIVTVTGRWPGRRSMRRAAAPTIRRA